jgi:hypothetical protein
MSISHLTGYKNQPVPVSIQLIAGSLGLLIADEFHANDDVWVLSRSQAPNCRYSAMLLHRLLKSAAHGYDVMQENGRRQVDSTSRMHSAQREIRVSGVPDQLAESCASSRDTAVRTAAL